MTQHQESHFDFIRRLACQYNEWMLYDGDKLVVGRPQDMPKIPMIYGTDMDRVQVSTRMRPVKSRLFSYHSLRDEPFDGGTEDKATGLDDLGNHGFEESKNQFGFLPLDFSSTRVSDKSILDNNLKNRQAASSSDISIISGNSSKQELRPGVIMDMMATFVEFGTWSKKSYGQFLVTAVYHQATGDNVYSNHFEGIPAGTSKLPEPTISRPIAHPQLAKVLSNTDPENKGRIQVQFQWQELQGLNTNWLRVMTPDAGSGNQHEENRGHVFIPEVGDQVMVGFRYGDPNRPFVMGGMFHGANGAGGGPENHLKTIITRSGHTVAFDDKEGSESITITDKSDNIIFIDTANNNIRISAPETIDIEAKNINIRASETLTQSSKNMKTMVSENKETEVGGDFIANVENSIEVSSNDSFETIGNDKTLEVGNALDITSSETKLVATNGDMNVQGAGVASFQGGSDVKVSKG